MFKQEGHSANWIRNPDVSSGGHLRMGVECTMRLFLTRNGSIGIEETTSRANP